MSKSDGDNFLLFFNQVTVGTGAPETVQTKLHPNPMGISRSVNGNLNFGAIAESGAARFSSFSS